ncbi:uncharacterized protein [Spinacia oleracea]|uniref:Uncharacterized protein n=1 Tax=Spinacia oleracea TaxID=3562 RepID=A0ABM3RM15_SPIOL|nr:uncharacterized protein LOC130470470 [Spinacia oleracea]
MASTLLATIEVTLSSLISAIVSSSSNEICTIHTTKYLSVLICFLVAFFCNMQTTRYYAHISFLLNVPESSDEGSEEFIEYVSQQLNRGCLFWSLGLRAFYFAFPVLLWIFGAIAMFACSCSMAILLYFLDTASSSPSYLYNGNVVKTNRNPDIESSFSLESLTGEYTSNVLSENRPPSEWLKDTLIELYLSGYPNTASEVVDNQQLPKETDDEDGFMLTTDGLCTKRNAIL